MMKYSSKVSSKDQRSICRFINKNDSNIKWYFYHSSWHLPHIRIIRKKKMIFMNIIRKRMEFKFASGSHSISCYYRFFFHCGECIYSCNNILFDIENNQNNNGEYNNEDGYSKVEEIDNLMAIRKNIKRVRVKEAWDEEKGHHYQWRFE